MTTSGENVDAVAVLADGRILVSTTGAVSVTGLLLDRVADERARPRWRPAGRIAAAAIRHELPDLFTAAAWIS